MNDKRCQRCINGSSVARIAGNILSGIAAATAYDASRGIVPLHEGNADQALALARYIARKAEESDCECAHCHDTAIEVAEIYAGDFARGKAEGAREEREAVVRHLRGMVPDSMYHTVISTAAGFIERGDHRKGEQ